VGGQQQRGVHRRNHVALVHQRDQHEVRLRNAADVIVRPSVWCSATCHPLQATLVVLLWKGMVCLAPITCLYRAKGNVT
jgi:hypothetical protein